VVKQQHPLPTFLRGGAVFNEGRNHIKNCEFGHRDVRSVINYEFREGNGRKRKGYETKVKSYVSFQRQSKPRDGRRDGRGQNSTSGVRRRGMGAFDRTRAQTRVGLCRRSDIRDYWNRAPNRNEIERVSNNRGPSPPPPLSQEGWRNR